MSEPRPAIGKRPSCASDLEFLARVYQGTREEELSSLGWSAAQQQAFARMQFDVRRRYYSGAYPEAEECVILCDDSPAGSMIINRETGGLRVVDIALLPEHRNRGIGGSLLSDLLGEARALQLPLSLSVLRSSPAIRLYRRLGFEPLPGDDEVYLEMEYRP